VSASITKGRGTVETFILAAVSLIIAISLIIYKKNDPVQLSFAALCLAIFVLKMGSFCRGIFGAEYIRIIEYAGLIAVPPLAIRFCRRFLHDQTLFSRDDVMSTLLFGLAVGLLYFTPLNHSAYLQPLLKLSIACVLLISYISLLVYIKKGTDNVEKRRMGYLAIALPIAALLSSLDIFYYLGFDFPPLYNLVLAALLYFVLLIIAYPHLTELHELMAKALLVSVVTAFAVILFYLVINLFGHTVQPPFTHVLVACFTIVISISPFKIILEKIFSAIYPESKDVFTSLYALDAKLERERALLLEEMAPVFAHEIRNPLGSIKGAAQYLRSEIDAGENAKLLDIIIEEVDRLNGVVSHFLNYAKPHSINLKERNINDIIAKAVSLIRANNVSESIIIETDLHPQIPNLAIDGEQLIQVILNIAFNAIDAMPEGGTLSIATAKVTGEIGEAVEIVIRDTGRGITKEDIKNIFKPFFTTKERGVGLGLAVCQRIIRNHGGYIRVRSVVGQGTLFYIRLRSPKKL
jgi:two-component system, NtrC family, sensor histidine kinase HydH